MEEKKEKISIEKIGTIDNELIGRADNAIILIPDNWLHDGQDPVYPTTLDPVRKLFKLNKLTYEPLYPIIDSVKYRDNRSIDWVAPIMLVTASFVSENPAAISIALNVISTYVVDIFKGLNKTPNIKLSIVLQKSDKADVRKVNYEGPASGLTELDNVIKNIMKEE